MNLRKFCVMFFQVTGILLILGLTAAYFWLAPINQPAVLKQVLFHPFKELDENASGIAAGVAKKEVYFHGVNGTKLNGWFFDKPGANLVVLFSHGNAGNLSHRIHKVKRFLDLGCSVFIYDYEGFGKSTGEPSQQGIIDDGCAAYDCLVNNMRYKPEQVVLYGESIGTAVTAQVSRLRPAAGMVLESAFVSPMQLARDKVKLLHIYPWFLWPEPDLNNLAVVRREHPQLLIVHGMLDDLINYSHGKRLFTEAPEPKAMVLLPNCNHSNIGFEHDTDLYVNGLKTFLDAIRQKQALAAG